MENLGWIELSLLVASLAFAGLVKGVTGMGLPLFATPLLANVVGPKAAVVVISIPTFVSNVFLLWDGRKMLRLLRDAYVLALTGVAGVVVGIYFLNRINQQVLALVIAGFVFLIVVRGNRLIRGDPASVRMRILAPVLGFGSGVMHGGTAISGPLVAGYLHAKNLTPKEFVISVAVVFQIYSIVQVLGLWQMGLYTAQLVRIGALSLIPSVLAMVVGIRLRDRLNNDAFHKVITVFLLLSAAVLVYQGLKGLGLLNLLRT